MTNYLYTHEEGKDIIEEKQALEYYCTQNNITINQEIHDSVSTKTHWTDREIGNFLKNCQAGDNIICYDACYFACSTSQLLEILYRANELKVNMHFVKYDMQVNNQEVAILTQKLLALISKIESEFISKRTTQALARRKAAGLPLGRPKGRGNKSLKLDKHKEDIEKYLQLGISKASIAKLVHCHPQTLYDWIDRNLARENKENNSEDASAQITETETA